MLINGTSDESIEVEISTAENDGRLSSLSNSDSFYGLFNEVQLDPDESPLINKAIGGQE